MSFLNAITGGGGGWAGVGVAGRGVEFGADFDQKLYDPKAT